MDINKKIGARINELLAKQNKKQKELSAFLGIKDNVVSYFVHGKRIPNIEQLIKIADFFDTTVDYLIGHSNTVSSDMDIQAMCKKLGITDETYETIKEINVPYLPYVDDVKYLIFNRFFSKKDEVSIVNLFHSIECACNMHNKVAHFMPMEDELSESETKERCMEACRINRKLRSEHYLKGLAVTDMRELASARFYEATMNFECICKELFRNETEKIQNSREYILDKMAEEYEKERKTNVNNPQEGE